MNEDASYHLIWMLAFWILLGGGIWLLGRRAGAQTVGGPLIYVALLSLIHFFGALIYAFPWYQPQSDYLIQQQADPVFVARGFEISLLGLVGFCLGVGIVNWRVGAFGIRSSKSWVDHRWLIGVGVVMKLVLTPFLGAIPSMSSVLWIGGQLAVVGFLLAAWRAWRKKELNVCGAWLAASVLFPLSTTLASGFIGYGMTSWIIIILFIQRYVKKNFLVGAVGLFAIYLGVSLWVTYARDRDQVRSVVWSGSGWSARIAQVASTLFSFEFFDPKNQRHLEFIDVRLNQNLLVGQAAINIETGGVKLAGGSTIAFSLVAWIPRAIWPGKPEFGGSGDMVSEFTGRYFDENSSFGVGQIMEFYINFKSAGVLIGMMILGAVIALLDRMAAVNLARGDSWGFVICFLPMLATLQPGGALSEIVASTAAAVVLLVGIHFTRNLTFGIHDIVQRNPQQNSSVGTRFRRVRGGHNGLQPRAGDGPEKWSDET